MGREVNEKANGNQQSAVIGYRKVIHRSARSQGKYAKIELVQGDAKHPFESLIAGYFAERHGVVAVYLFGSTAAGQATPASDVDIAVLYQRGQEPDFQLEMDDKIELARLLGRDVDLIHLNQASPILRMQVLKKGKLVLNRDPKHLNFFFVNTLNEYFDLKQSRKPIEKALYDVSIYD